MQSPRLLGREKCAPAGDKPARLRYADGRTIGAEIQRDFCSKILILFTISRRTLVSRISLLLHYSLTTSSLTETVAPIKRRRKFISRSRCRDYKRAP
ncbi:hypothetical protein PUN28_000167 [Cardiocondyla obscurior]|uniref:Uncharacterized protein n=1 Tax=Cardiocondyla obscurior TaxID=286306 RepID=A0AAW2GY73_9HYME